MIRERWHDAEWVAAHWPPEDEDPDVIAARASAERLKNYRAPAPDGDEQDAGRIGSGTWESRRLGVNE